MIIQNTLKISDAKNNIQISDIKIFSSKINENIVLELFHKGDKGLDLLKNKYGLNLVNNFDFSRTYKNNILLDSGKNLNHVTLNGSKKYNKVKINTCQEIYLPFRLQGEYKSLVHKEDTEIIKKYYKHDPDIEENVDIFFHDIIPNSLDYKSIGLSTLIYSILDIQNKKDYELIRIVT